MSIVKAQTSNEDATPILKTEAEPISKTKPRKEITTVDKQQPSYNLFNYPGSVYGVCSSATATHPLVMKKFNFDTLTSRWYTLLIDSDD